MKSFSERHGITPIKSTIQSESMDEALRNSLWNALCLQYLNTIQGYLSENHDGSKELLLRLWVNFFKNKIDEQPSHSSNYKKFLKAYFFSCQWYDVYNLMDFFPNNYRPTYHNNKNLEFVQYCNAILEREVSAFRFVEGIITQITNDEEIESIESALNISDKFGPIKQHLRTSLELFSNREKPDYRNSIKESISAVEALSKIIINDNKATLGQALTEIEKKHQIPKALKAAFSSLYGYTSDEGGIRHSLLEDNIKVEAEESRFMLVACSAFTNYLISKI